MKKIRFVGLAIITFVVTLVATLLEPGTLINRFFAVVMCGVLSFDATACTVNLAKSSNKVLATSPGLMEKVVTNHFEQLLGQRSGEFDNNPTPTSDPQAPPYPVDPGPNFPVRRPDFDDDGSVQPTPQQPQINTPNFSNPNQVQTDNLDGIWIYSVYTSSTPGYLLFRVPIKVNNREISICKNCQSSELPSNYFANKIPQEQSTVAEYEHLTFETVASTDNQAIWGQFHNPNNNNKFFFTIAKISDYVPVASHNKKIDSFSSKQLLIASINKSYISNILSSEKNIEIKSLEKSNLRMAVCIPTYMQNAMQNAKTIENIKKGTNIANEIAAKEGAKAAAYEAQRIRDFWNYINEIKILGHANLLIGNPKYVNNYNPEIDYTHQFLKTIIASKKQDIQIIAQCIPPQVLSVLGEIAAIAALALALGVTLAMAEWCFKNPKGCELLLRNPDKLFPPPPPPPKPLPPQPPCNSCDDPHLTTLDGQKYDHHAVGEFVLTRTKNRQFEIQVREAPYKSSDKAAINSAIAMKVGNAKVGIYASGSPDDKQNMPLWINGQAVDLKGSQSLPGGGSITLAGDRNWAVQWPTGEYANFHIRDVGGSSMVNVSIAPTQGDRNQLEGLLGNFNGNTSDDFMTRDGTIIRDNKEAFNAARSILNNFDVSKWIPIPLDPIAEAFFESLHRQFGDSWRISQEESLFDYAPGKNTESFTNTSFPNGFVVLRMLAPQAVQMAEQACRDAGVEGDRLENCLFDVAVTEDTGFANMVGNFIKNQVEQQIQQQIQQNLPIPGGLPIPIPFPKF